MSAPLREQFANNAFTLTDGGIDGSQTTIDVIDGSDFPSTGNFRLIVEDEIILCTARSTNTLTVVRGAEGTTGASHADGTPIAHILTDASFNRMVKDSVVLGGDDSAMPPLNTLVDDNGDVIDSTDFTWVNQGGAAVTDQNGTVVMRVPVASGDNFRLQQRAAPAAPYSYIAAFQAVSFKGNITLPNFGMGFRDSGSGKFIAFLILNDADSGQRLQVSKLNSATSYNSDIAARENLMLVGPVLWLKIEDNNTNLLFSISADGIEWIQVASIGRTSFSSAPDNVVWFGNNVGSGGGADLLVRLCHWSRAS